MQLLCPSTEKKDTISSAHNQIDTGNLLSNVLTFIHAFAEAEEDARIFMAKWDITYGFWRLDAEEGAEWNFSYVLPQHPGEPIYLVIPTSLQMGWVESPPFFCAASETARDVAQDYCETKLSPCNHTNSPTTWLAIRTMKTYLNGMNWSSFFDTSSKYMWTTLLAL